MDIKKLNEVLEKFLEQDYASEQKEYAIIYNDCIGLKMTYENGVLDVTSAQTPQINGQGTGNSFDTSLGAYFEKLFKEALQSKNYDDNGITKFVDEVWPFRQGCEFEGNLIKSYYYDFFIPLRNKLDEVYGKIQSYISKLDQPTQILYEINSDIKIGFYRCHLPEVGNYKTTQNACCFVWGPSEYQMEDEKYHASFIQAFKSIIKQICKKFPELYDDLQQSINNTNNKKVYTKAVSQILQNIKDKQQARQDRIENKKHNTSKKYLFVDHENGRYIAIQKINDIYHVYLETYNEGTDEYKSKISFIDALTKAFEDQRQIDDDNGLGKDEGYLWYLVEAAEMNYELDSQYLKPAINKQLKSHPDWYFYEDDEKFTI